MPIRNLELLRILGRPQFPAPYQGVRFEAADGRLSSSHNPNMGLTIWETGILAATITMPREITPYSTIFIRMNQLIGEEHYHDPMDRDTLKVQTHRLRTKLEEMFRYEHCYSPAQQILAAVNNQGYILLPHPTSRW